MIKLSYFSTKRKLLLLHFTYFFLAQVLRNSYTQTQKHVFGGFRMKNLWLWDVIWFANGGWKVFLCTRINNIRYAMNVMIWIFVMITIMLFFSVCSSYLISCSFRISSMLGAQRNAKASQSIIKLSAELFSFVCSHFPGAPSIDSAIIH